MSLSRLSILFIVAACASAQDSRVNGLVKQLEQTHNFSGVSISPDGQWITWAERAADNRGSAIYLLDWKNGSAKPRRLTAGNGKSSFSESGVAWSPDSTQLAFFSNAGSSQEQLFVAPVRSGKSRRLTNVDGYVRDIRWAPDGKQIAFLYAEGGGGGGPLEAEPAAVGVIGSNSRNQQITVVNPAGGEIRQISPASLNVYEYDWSPDGQRFAAIAAPGPADNNWWIAQLYLVDAASGKMDSIYRPPVEQQIAVPRWSPDGNQIAFIGGLMSDEGFNGGDIFVLASGGGTPHNLTSDRKSTPTWFAWHGSRELIFTENVEGASAISTLNIANNEARSLWRGGEEVTSGGNRPDFDLARDGSASVVVQSSWEKAPEVWAGPIGEWHQITTANTAQVSHWGKAESVVWNSDEFRVQGWLLFPENYDPGKRYPMIVEIHGGPSGIRTPSWPTSHFDMSIMAGLGYFVFFPNPRGSYGEGESFTRANVKDFGGGDLRDVLAGVDAVLKQAPVDNDRLGVTGWSYGGFMTMWTVTQTNRFRAAVSGAGIADWLSYYGENSIDEWMIPFFGATVYDDPAVYAKSSPITYIKQVKTPTLVVVGERDGECPAPQSFEFWHALKTDNVSTQLVVYAGEGHAFHDPKDQTDVLRRALGWFDEYLSTGVQKASAP